MALTLPPARTACQEVGRESHHVSGGPYRFRTRPRTLRPRTHARAPACVGPAAAAAHEDRLDRAVGHRVGPGRQRAAQPVLVQRAGERRALAVGAAHRAQGDDLLGQVDPVGHGLQPEVAGDPQQPAGDLVQPGGLDDALDETRSSFSTSTGSRRSAVIAA